jgi:hypothetical protein
VAICIDDDLTSKRPSDDVIASVARIIAENYREVAEVPGSIIGHNEVTKTECPGRLFQTAWKQTLLDEVARL